MFEPEMLDPEMIDERYSPYREPLDDLVAIEEDLKNHPENKKLLENALGQKIEIVKYFLEDKFQNDTRMQKYMVELEDQALLNWHLYLLRHFKSMEEPLVEGGYIRVHFNFSIWQDIIEVALECKRPNMNPSKNISEQMQPFYRKYDVMIEKYVGDVSFNEKRYKFAIKKYEAALKHTIDEADYIQYRVTLHNNIAECYSRLEEGDNHGYDYEDDSKCAKLDMKSLVWGAEHFLEKENFKEALRCCSIMLQKNSFFDNAHKLKAIALRKMNKEKVNAEKAIGNNYFREKRYKEAIKKYEDVIEECGSDITLFNNIATCYFKLGQEDSHNFVVSRAMSIKALSSSQGVAMFRVPCYDADPKDISKSMARIGMCYESEKNIEKAIEWFQKSLARYPDEHLGKRILKLRKKLGPKSAKQATPCMGCGSRNSRVG